MVNAIQLLINKRPSLDEKGKFKGDSLSPVAPFRVVNIGNASAVRLLDYIEQIERVTGKVVEKNMMKIQSGDVPETLADTQLLYQITGYSCKVSYEEGIKRFVKWYQDYFTDN